MGYTTDNGYYGSGAAAFTPASIAGLQLWLDASSSPKFQNSNGTTAAVDDGDPVGYWGDLSGNARHATQATGAARPTLKLPVPAVLFDGIDDALLLPTNAGWDVGTTDFAFSWWEYRTGNDNGRSAIVRNATAQFPAFVLGYSSAGANLLVYMTSQTGSWDIANGKSLGVVTLNTWNHFVVTRDGEDFFAYKNGAQTDTWTSALAMFASADALSIGTYASFYFLGKIHEIASWWGRSLTAGEVSALYSAKSATVTE